MSVLLFWSSGKDAAWTLHRLRQRDGVAVRGLLTTFADDGRVGLHGTPRELVQAQAAAAGLPLVPVELPRPCPNEAYERRVGAALRRAREDGATHVAFGDLHLHDVRDYRASLLEGTGLEPLFPLWGAPDASPALAREMQRGGLRAAVTCVETRRVPAELAGRAWDADFLDALPAGVDPCGENGEFHTFCSGGPMFARPIPVRCGAPVDRDGFRIVAPEPAPAR